MTEYIFANSDTEYAAASVLFKEYAAWLSIDLCFQKFDEELLQLPQMYGPPSGAIILVKHEEEFAGCIAVRKKETEISELKRMYVRPAYRKLGIGEKLLEKAILFAQNAGYRKIRLDTLSEMTSAINLYKKHGFYEIPAYYHNPESTAVYFEKSL